MTVTASHPTAWTDLKGRRVLIVGASSGIGAHFARVLARHGADVAVAARRRTELRQLADEVAASGCNSCAVEIDVLQEASIEAGWVLAERALGPIHVLVNAAGIAISKPFLEQTAADWDAALGTNLRGAFLAGKIAAGAMAKRGGGSIINVASILGLRQAGHVAPYAASKAALIQLTKQMALELARVNVRVNAIAPGYFATPINKTFLESPSGQALIGRIPLRRAGQLHELDGPLLLLASDASSFMTGAILTVDGGHLVSCL